MKAQVNVHYQDRAGRDCFMMEYPVIELHPRFVCLRIMGLNVDFTRREVILLPNEADVKAGYRDRIMINGINITEMYSNENEYRQRMGMDMRKSFKNWAIRYCIFIAGVMAGYAWAWYHFH